MKDVKEKIFFVLVTIVAISLMGLLMWGIPTLLSLIFHCDPLFIGMGTVALFLLLYVLYYIGCALYLIGFCIYFYFSIKNDVDDKNKDVIVNE